MKIIVDTSQRYAKMRAHTATHLLHASLEKILGQTKQEGSLVDEDYLRFDFATEKPLTHDQLRVIEDAINNHIRSAHPVHVQHMSIDEARRLGAKMFFGDKYGEEVRMVTIGNNISKELCGGTHVENTKDIGACIIVSQESVSSGVKRITAYTGPKVAVHAQDKSSLLQSLVSELGVASESQLLPKIQKIQSTIQSQNDTIEGLKAKLVGGVLQSIKLTPQGKFDGIIPVTDYLDLQGLKIKTIAMEARNIYSQHTILIYDDQGTFALIASGEDSARDIARDLGLKGGGSDDLVQGRDSDLIDKIS